MRFSFFYFCFVFLLVLFFMSTHQPQYGVIFDMDGTLADNIPVHFQVFTEVFKDHNVEISVEKMKNECSGLRNPEILEIFFPNASEEEKEAISIEKEKRYKAYYEHRAEELEGLTLFLKDLKAHGVRMAIGTSAPIENLEFFTQALNIRSYFDVEIFDKSVVNGKPHPEVFITAARELGVLPEHCIVFEDAKAGIQAAHNAKMRVACVTTSHTAEELKEAGAIWSMPDYSQMNYERLIALFEQEATHPQFIQSQYV